MKKEVVVAICIGFLIGAGAALSILYFPSVFKKGGDASKQEAIAQPSQTPPIAPSDTAALQIETPQDETIAGTKSSTVKGKTQKGNIVVIDTDTETMVPEVGPDGTFEQKTTLSEGGNVITVSSYDTSGSSETKTITVFYTEEKI